VIRKTKSDEEEDRRPAVRAMRAMRALRACLEDVLDAREKYVLMSSYK
jgi:hypothetical protein